MNASRSILAGTACLVALAVSSQAAPVCAQDSILDRVDSDSIVVTARKREENVQTVPLAVTAFQAEQLEALNFTTLETLTFSMPNVQLSSLGSVPSTANFSIRGLGIVSSIPSVDPTVGVFVDGVYMGINTGIVVDNFDVASIEVLRGPQGVLFGRNVTGGAVLITTAAPTNQFKANGRLALESGPRWAAEASLSGPLIDDRLSAKLAVYHSNDDGYFSNSTTKRGQGASETSIFRGALKANLTESLDVTVRGEYGEIDGNASAYRNDNYFAVAGKLIQDTAGLGNFDWKQGIIEANQEVAFGNGRITSITGWRSFNGESLTDIDGTSSVPGIVDGFDFGLGAKFDLFTKTKQSQFSQELRYSGKFGAVDLTLGGYYFNQHLKYLERRIVDTNLVAAGVSDTVGGGDGKFTTLAFFSAIDWRVVDGLTLNFGLRYSRDKKTADISRIRGPGNVFDGVAGGDYAAGTLNISDRDIGVSFNSLSPKIGFQWTPMERTQVYGYWAKAFRSGGVNFRQTTLGLPPVPFGDERQTSFEIGLKHEFWDRRATFNVAAFTNLIRDMQRDQIVPDPVSGVQQVISNAGDAKIQGFEVEGRVRALDSLLLTMQVGFQDAHYKRVFVDLNGDRLVNERDRSLVPPRAAPWSYGASAIHELDFAGLGSLSTRVSYTHRDTYFVSDNNLGISPKADIFDVNLTITPAGSIWNLSLYVNNLTKEDISNSSPLPDLPGFGGDGAGPRPIPTVSVLSKGRVFGVALRARI